MTWRLKSHFSLFCLMFIVITLDRNANQDGKATVEIVGDPSVAQTVESEIRQCIGESSRFQSSNQSSNYMSSTNNSSFTRPPSPPPQADAEPFVGIDWQAAARESVSFSIQLLISMKMVHVM